MARSQSYGLFAYGMPSGNFVQVKIAGLTGTNELSDRSVEHPGCRRGVPDPDVEAPEKATEQIGLPQRKCRRRGAPSPRKNSVVVLNGNGVAGSAANTSYPLAQKGYRVESSRRRASRRTRPASGRRVPDADLLQRARRGAQLAAVKHLGAASTRPTSKPMPREQRAADLANGAMLTVVVGQNFSGKLTPTPVDQTPPKQPPYVRPGRSARRCPPSGGGRVEGRLPAPDPDRHRALLRSSTRRSRTASTRSTTAEDRPLHLPDGLERVLGHPGDELGRRARPRGQELQRR